MVLASSISLTSKAHLWLFVPLAIEGGVSARLAMHGNWWLLRRVRNYLTLAVTRGLADECRAGPIAECNVTDITVLSVLVSKQVCAQP